MKLFVMRKDVISYMNMVGKFIILILTRDMYTPFKEKVRMGNFLVKMEIRVYRTLLKKRSHLIGPCHKGMRMKK